MSDSAALQIQCMLHEQVRILKENQKIALKGAVFRSLYVCMSGIFDGVGVSAKLSIQGNVILQILYFNLLVVGRATFDTSVQYTKKSRVYIDSFL